jgi:hypothetical protein
MLLIIIMEGYKMIAKKLKGKWVIFDGNDSSWHLQLYRIFGMNNFSDKIQIIVDKFNCKIVRNVLEFKNEEDCKQAIEWIESIILMGKLMK